MSQRYKKPGPQTAGSDDDDASIRDANAEGERDVSSSSSSAIFPLCAQAQNGHETIVHAGARCAINLVGYFPRGVFQQTYTASKRSRAGRVHVYLLQYHLMRFVSQIILR